MTGSRIAFTVFAELPLGAGNASVFGDWLGQSEAGLGNRGIPGVTDDGP